MFLDLRQQASNMISSGGVVKQVCGKRSGGRAQAGKMTKPVLGAVKSTISHESLHMPPPVRATRAIYFTRQLLTNVSYTHSASSQRDVAFEREAIPWIDDVYRFALSLTRDESDADDVVQDTFLRAFRSWHTYMPGSDCRRWLFTICRNVFLRSRERARPTVELDAPEVDAAAVGSLYSLAARDGLDEMFARLDLGPAISTALSTIPEPFRSTLIIVDVEDQSYESAAEILGVPIGTVRSRLFRGRRLMQEQLLTHAKDAGFGRRPAEGEHRANARDSQRSNSGRVPARAAARVGLPRRPTGATGDGIAAGAHG